jgi:polysaccharide deacetylase family protein (PEP-CTERM system associated)
MSAIKHPYSIDLEDWYQGIELPLSEWAGKEDRLHKGMDKIIELLDESKTKCTFFTLGWIGEHYPQLIRKLANAGHEIASHGYCHEKVYTLTPQAFREETRKAKDLLENASGQAVRGFRAPFFSINSQTLWALEILKECGFEYDCSISPVKTWRYGISGCPEKIFNIAELDLIEYPVTVFKLLGKKFNVGGAYFRIFPYALFHRTYKNNSKIGYPTMFYAHPWEFDPEHPVIEFERKAMMTHYHNLKGMYKKTEKLLNAFPFTTVWDVLENAKKNKLIGTESINVLKELHLKNA